MPPEELNQELVVESLRDTLSANMDAAEAGTLGQDAGAVQPVDAGAADAQRQRDEQGRFAARQAAEVAAAPVDAAAAPAPVEAAKPSLTTWRKEYLPIQAKLESGQSLLPDEARKLAEYNVQREREYSTGIASHRAEAQHAKALTDVVQEFMPQLQQANMNPADWIQRMGRTHCAIVAGTPEQKLHIFAQLAQSYGVPLGAVQQAAAGQVDPNMLQMMQRLDEMQKSVQGVSTWREQQEQESINNELAKFSDASKYPHFEQVRGDMAQLLETGVAKDLDTAYSKAVRLNDEAWNAEQQRQAAALATSQTAGKAAAAARARQASGSVRSGASAVVTKAAPSNDIRESLESAFDQHTAAGRV
jgi:hypothetical protein